MSNQRGIATSGEAMVPAETGEGGLSADQRVLKRCLDLTLAVPAVIVLAPIACLIALVVVLESRGAPIFAQRRIGAGGKPFTMFKFRTMVRGASDMQAQVLHLNEAAGPLFKVKRDPRLTRIGALLRSCYLDELPQLVNVVLGEMSLVGPRPCLPAELEVHGDDMLFRLSVPQGITGPWQIGGSHQLSFAEQLLEERLYVRDWSLLRDFEIILRTVGLVARRTGL